MFKIILIGLSLFAITACGGGSSTAPTDPNKSFSLSKLQSTTVGTTYSTNLIGSDSYGYKYSGSFAIANRAQTMLNGVLVTPQDTIITLADDEISFTVTGTSYVDTSGYLISTVIQTTGLSCTPVSPDNIPTSVKIGDFGILSTLICSDKTTMERNWRIEDAGNGNIHVISNSTIKDQFSTVVSVTDVLITITDNGNIIKFKTSSAIVADNYTLSYESV